MAARLDTNGEEGGEFGVSVWLPFGLLLCWSEQGKEWPPCRRTNKHLEEGATFTNWWPRNFILCCPELFWGGPSLVAAKCGGIFICAPQIGMCPCCAPGPASCRKGLSAFGARASSGLPLELPLELPLKLYPRLPLILHLRLPAGLQTDSAATRSSGAPRGTRKPVANCVQLSLVVVSSMLLLWRPEIGPGIGPPLETVCEAIGSEDLLCFNRR